ncbi:MAG: hypothetical protein HC769_37240 [Cyanobacteria bacterium CRU_2_1]|nr:hypothetical protein [Cyanobacteria bacterium CRU_2_1]
MAKNSYLINLQPGKTYSLKLASNDQWQDKVYVGSYLKCDDYGCETFLKFQDEEFRADVFTRLVLFVREVE